ncbi:hypothetical protein KVR01_006535 [Diaporthe batatas]|uniref:uncharacterized protein n=1 Tax=Diaporthe batatas TaxID=748121 RepID=UPI001D037623|nr:uncharacterized protein KVR01_006535 [Diaporthe batatas]KAG8163238.1 hypothetical protein KVR01_006535 [Diaporthe batatas]
MANISPSAFLAAAIAALFIFLARLNANRQHVRKLQAANAPMPTYHPVFGHFIALKECIQALPRNSTIHLVVQLMARQFPEGIFYLNLWPFNSTLMVVTDPFVASQVENAFLDKPEAMCSTLEVINGGPSLMTMHGATWKKWRGLFNQGFAPGYITGLAPAMAEEVAVFCDLLRKLAGQDQVFPLEEYTLRLTFDIIGRATLDARLRYQTQGSALAECLRRQVLWTPFATTYNPFRRWLTIRPFIQKYNSYRMNRYLDVEIEKRFKERALAGSMSSPSKSVISLAMEKELGAGQMSEKTFKEVVKPQLRMFLFAGHDTTSSTLLYCYLLLSRHPEVLAMVRAEHDKVFGPDFSTEHCSSMIASDPTLLNEIPYTLAVTKEVLRIFPPAASLREGRPDLILTDEQGRQYPTEGCHIWTLSLVMHHRPDVFIRPEEFIPERWLASPGDPLYPKKGSWRAFEWGARACIGQTLAQLELRVVLVMTARMFDITPAYDEWDRMHPRTGMKTANGERVYQAELGGGGAHPADGFPVRIALRK